MVLKNFRANEQMNRRIASIVGGEMTSWVKSRHYTLTIRVAANLQTRVRPN
jgi:hypothetical protein